MQHRQVVALLGGGQGFFHPVVPRDDNRVDGSHRGVGRGERPAVTAETLLPP